MRFYEFFHTYPDVVYLLLKAKKRLQELFEKYDVSGDGVLSEEVRCRNCQLWSSQLSRCWWPVIKVDIVLPASGETFMSIRIIQDLRNVFLSRLFFLPHFENINHVCGGSKGDAHRPQSIGHSPSTGGRLGKASQGLFWISLEIQSKWN